MLICKWLVDSPPPLTRSLFSPIDRPLMPKSQDDTYPSNRKKDGSDPSDQREDEVAGIGSGPLYPQQQQPLRTNVGPRKYVKDFNPLYRLMKKLSEHSYAQGEQFDFQYDDIIQILIKIKSTLQLGELTVDTVLMRLPYADPPLVRCDIPVVIVGDIHGQFNDLVRVFEQFSGKNKPGWLNKPYVFLGDYVDRGKQSLEVIAFVFLMKIFFKKSVYLLRGNHECKAINRVYGFSQELAERFEKDKGNNLFHMFNEAFTHMPLACLVGKIILCMHGGISPKLTSLDDIMKIPKPLVDPNSNELACDLMWADPMINLKGFKPNAIRGVSVHFGEDVLHSTMAQLGVKLIVRGHQMMMNGYNFFGKQKLVTVFTAASYYPDRANRGAVLHVDKTGRLGFFVVSPSPGGGGAQKAFTGDHEDANKYDVGYILSVADEKKMMPGGFRM